MALTTNFLVGVASEPVYGDSPFAAALPTRYMAVEVCDITPNAEILESQDVTNSFSGRKHERQNVDCDVNVVFKLTPPVGVQPSKWDWSPFLLASRLTETLVDDVVDYYEYRPSTLLTDADTPACSVVKYMVDDSDLTAGRKILARGCRGNFGVTVALDSFVRGRFTGKGLYQAWPSGTTVIPAAGVNPIDGFSGELAGLKASQVTITVGAQTVCLSAFEFNTNWAVAGGKCIGHDGSVEEVELDRPKGSRMGGTLTLKGRAATLNTLLPYIDANTEFEIVVTFEDGSSWTLPKGQFGSYGMSNVNGRVNFDIPYFLNGTWDGVSEAGDNEVIIHTGTGAAAP